MMEYKTDVELLYPCPIADAVEIMQRLGNEGYFHADGYIWDEDGRNVDEFDFLYYSDNITIINYIYELKKEINDIRSKFIAYELREIMEENND